MALRTWRSITALTGTVPFTTRDTVAVETPAFFATSRIFTCGRDPLPFSVRINSACDVSIDATHHSQLYRPGGDKVTIAHR